ncbi:MAG TPA: LLM class flavin-dependent oxidoreductase [Hyphomicrobiaceae bacterium]|nr:LLM class flavin-dependent oxidoreductase [Hyphomicrobiaceae bacterium]
MSDTKTSKPRFAVQIGAVAAPGATDREMYHEALVDAQLVQELGFDAAWLVEHHFSDYYPTPNPLLMLSHIAAACPGLGLGTAVMVLPWYDPVRFAEDVCMLATLTTGPLYIGMGRGTAKLEYDALRVPMGEARERFRECWEITQLALAGKPFTYTGQYIKLERPITVRPVLDQTRDIRFFGAIGSPASAEIMADLGLRPLSLAQFPDHMLVKILQRWRARATALGQSEAALANGMLPISAKCFIADTDAEAREEAREHLARFYRLQAEHYTTDTTAWGDIPGYEQFAKIFGNMKLMGDPAQNDPILDRSLIGSPETVARRINELRAIGFDYFLVSNATADVPSEARHRMMRRFAEEVIPLANKLPVPAAPEFPARAAE